MVRRSDYEIVNDRIHNVGKQLDDLLEKLKQTL